MPTPSDIFLLAQNLKASQTMKIMASIGMLFKHGPVVRISVGTLLLFV